MRFGKWIIAALAMLASVQVAAAQVCPSCPKLSDADPWTDVEDSVGVRMLRKRMAAQQASVSSDIRQPEETVAPGEMAFPTPTATSEYENLTTPVIASNEPTHNWVGGFSSYLLKPHWSGQNQPYTRNVAGTASPFSYYIDSSANFKYDYAVTPAIWIGYLHSSGNGIRLGLFQYNQNAQTSVVSTRGETIFDAYFSGFTGLGNFTIDPGDRMTFGSSLQIVAWDLEGTKRFETGDWSWTGTAGLRYMYFAEVYAVNLFAVDGTFNSSYSRHYLNGAGPTISASGRRSLGYRGLGLYGTGRISTVFGSFNQTASSLTVGGTTPTTLVGFGVQNWGVMPVGELEIGIDYRRPWRNCTLVFDNGLVGQAYFNAGTLSGVNAVDGSHSDATLGLFGYHASVGIYY